MADMSLANVTSGRIDRPLRISLCGVDGVGKTSFAAGAPNPIFIATEDGTHHVDVARFPVPDHWGDLVGPSGAIAKLYYDEHNYRTLAIDSIDWAEALCDRYLVERYNAETQKSISSISEIPYGGWKAMKMVEFGVLLDWLSALVRVRNMHIVLISHAEIRRFDDPEREAYERYQIAMFPPLAAKVREWADYHLFANYDTTVRTVGTGFHERAVGSSHGKRLLFTQRRAAYDAKARFPVPERLDLNWDVFWAAHQAAAATIR